MRSAHAVEPRDRPGRDSSGRSRRSRPTLGSSRTRSSPTAAQGEDRPLACSTGSRDTADGKLVCVTAITPTKAGEGKTTTSVSLTQGLGHIGRKPVLCLREASLGPVFGIKGGAAGGGYAQVVPMEDLNLHFTGDIHAIGAANNLLAAMLEAHILHGNALGIDPLSIGWRRCVDINDRALRDVVVGLGGRANGYVRETGFDITAASEVMAIVAVARDLHDLRERLGAITVALHVRGRAGDRRAAAGGRRDDRPAQGRAQAEPRPDARGPAGARPLRPVREHRARQQLARRRPRRAQARRLRRHRVRLRRRHGHGEVPRHRLPRRRPQPERGRPRRDRRRRSSTTAASRTAASTRSSAAPRTSRGTSRSCAEFGLKAVVAVNRFPGDTDEEVELVRRLALEHGAHAAELNEAFERGGAGAAALAEAVVDAADHPNEFELHLPDRRADRRRRSRRSRSASTAPTASSSSRRRRTRSSSSRTSGLDRLPICMAKTHLSLSHDPELAERADRLRGDRARRPRLHGRRLARRALRRRCRRCPASARRRPRSTSTSTRTGARLGSSSFLDLRAEGVPRRGAGADAGARRRLGRGGRALRWRRA